MTDDIIPVERRYTMTTYDVAFRIHPDGSVTNYDGSPMSLEKMERCAPAIATMMRDAEALKSASQFMRKRREKAKT